MAHSSTNKEQREREAEKADPAQFARFVQAARDLECDDREEVFEEAFAKVAPARRPGEAAPSQAEAKARAKAPKRSRRNP
jgi:hypothetical protein